jgi:hypothetical protein
MTDFSAEVNKMSTDEMVAKLRTDPSFVGNALGFVAEKHPEIFATPEEVFTIQEVATELGVELPESNK